MCHTPFLSFVLAVSGTSLALASKRKKNPMWVVFALYSLMEWLQTTQHFFVDSCGTTMNLFLSYVAFGLVVVQPLTWNFYRWLKSTTVRQRAAFSCAMWLSFLWLVFFSARLIPRSSLPSGGTIYQALSKHEIMVGTEVCTRMGPTHLFWTFPLFSFNGVEMNWGKIPFLFICSLLCHNCVDISHFYRIKMSYRRKRICSFCCGLFLAGKQEFYLSKER